MYPNLTLCVYRHGTGVRCSNLWSLSLSLWLQPTDDIVLMAQSLEKAFLQKVAQMPQEEIELPPPAPRAKLGKVGKPGKGRRMMGKFWRARLCVFYVNQDRYRRAPTNRSGALVFSNRMMVL